MSKFVIFSLIGLLVLLDQIAPRLADRQLRSNGTIESAISTLMPSLNELKGRTAKTCDIMHIYGIYLYQICFRPYVSGNVEYEDGYHLVYHKPKPRLSIIMPANGPDSYYFKELVQGEFILFVETNGTIRYGDGR